MYPGGPISVLHVITDLSSGGAQTMLCKLIESSADPKINHNVLTLIDGGVNLERLRDAGVAVRELGFSRATLGLGSAGAAMKLIKAVGRCRPSVIQAWMYHANLAATFAAMMRRDIFLAWGVRHSVVSLQEEKWATALTIRLGKTFKRFCDAIVYCSHESAEQHERLGYPGDKKVVIPNGFDCDVFRPVLDAGVVLRSELGIADDQLVIGMVARWHPMKDHNNLLRAIEILRGRGLQPHLVIVGHGFDEQNKTLAADVGRAGLQTRCSLLGLRKGIAGVVAGFDIMVLPSAWGEGFPNVLGEAMACGVPCVATDVGDSRRIIDGTGRVVEPRNSEALANALQTMIELGIEGRRRLGEQARRRIKDHFEIGVIAEIYEQFYLSCSDGSRQLSYSRFSR